MSSIAESASLRAMENGKRGIGIQTAYFSFLAVAASSTLTSLRHSFSTARCLGVSRTKISGGGMPGWKSNPRFRVADGMDCVVVPGTFEVGGHVGRHEGVLDGRLDLGGRGVSSLQGFAFGKHEVDCYFMGVPKVA